MDRHGRSRITGEEKGCELTLALERRHRHDVEGYHRQIFTVDRQVRREHGHNLTPAGCHCLESPEADTTDKPTSVHFVKATELPATANSGALAIRPEKRLASEKTIP